MARPCQARLNLAALRHNIGVARDLAPRANIMAVVKADAYGHGAVAIAREIEALTDALGVAAIEEAVQLREAGINSPILLLQGVFDARELAVAAEMGLWVTVENEWQLRWMEEAILPARLRCWLKVDTGMHRLGVTPAALPDYYARLLAADSVADQPVICTHFACADQLDNDKTQQQIALFDRVCGDLPSQRSAANSAGVLAWPQAHYQWVRPGYMLYGNSPFRSDHPAATNLRPVMTLASSVISVRTVSTDETVGYGAVWAAPRPSIVATVTAGYGDGYPRNAATGTPVLINGHRGRLVGRVSMDMITVDVTDLPDVQIGDEAILWGDGLPVNEVARHANTIGYELTTRMPSRVPRVIVAN